MAINDVSVGHAGLYLNKNRCRRQHYLEKRIFHEPVPGHGAVKLIEGSDGNYYVVGQRQIGFDGEYYVTKIASER